MGERFMKSETSQRQNKEKEKMKQTRDPGAEEVEKIARRWSQEKKSLRKCLGEGHFLAKFRACSNLNRISKVSSGAPRIETEGDEEPAQRSTRTRQNRSSALQNSAPSTKHARSSSHKQPPNSSNPEQRALVGSKQHQEPDTRAGGVKSSVTCHRGRRMGVGTREILRARCAAGPGPGVRTGQGRGKLFTSAAAAAAAVRPQGEEAKKATTQVGRQAVRQAGARAEAKAERGAL